MSAIDEAFAAARAQGRKLLMPFITAGDPDLEFTLALRDVLAASGAGMVELGFPYSDPIADGPVIQASYHRALVAGVKVEGILRALAEAPPPPIPTVAMVSFAIVYRHGAARFLEGARRSHVSGLIVPDLPIDEADRLADQAAAADLSLVQLVTPTTPRDRACRIAEVSRGFLYYVAVTGITGERRSLPPELAENIAWLRGQTDLPICVGFGVSRPEHVRELAPVADGLIVGSALVRRMAQVDGRPRAEALADVGAFVESLVDALG